MKNAERYVSNSLRRLAEEMPPAHVDFETVRRQAGHRPTRVVVLAVAAAATAIALPIGVLYYLNQSEGTPQPAATTSTPSQAPSPSTDLAPLTPQTPAPERTVTIPLKDLTVGAAPELPYYSNGSIYSADGKKQVTVHVPENGSVRSFARYGDGWVVLLQDDQLAGQILLYDATGTLVRAVATQAQSIAQGQDGWVAVSLDPGQITLVDADGNEIHTWVLPDYYDVSPVAVLPDHSVVFYAKARSTRSYVALRALPDGDLEALAYGRPFSVNPANLDLSLGHFCLAVYETDPERPSWETCPYMIDGVFSPDGRYLVARTLNGVETQGDVRTKVRSGIGIIDAQTGAVVLRLESKPQVIIASMAWEDDTHALVMAYDGTWRALRVGVDGAVEQARTVDLSAKYLDFPQFNWVH